MRHCKAGGRTQSRPSGQTTSSARCVQGQNLQDRGGQEIEEVAGGWNCWRAARSLRGTWCPRSPQPSLFLKSSSLCSTGGSWGSRKANAPPSPPARTHHDVLLTGSRRQKGERGRREGRGGWKSTASQPEAALSSTPPQGWGKQETVWPEATQPERVTTCPPGGGMGCRAVPKPGGRLREAPLEGMPRLKEREAQSQPRQPRATVGPQCPGCVQPAGRKQAASITTPL